MNAPFTRNVIAAALAMTALTACAVSEAPPVEPRVQAMIDANRAYPRWENFPAAPVDVPEPVQIAGQVNALAIGRSALESEVARIEWTLADAEGWARAVTDRVNAVPVSPDAIRTREEIDAFARSLRDRGRAPPPVPRR